MNDDYEDQERGVGRDGKHLRAEKGDVLRDALFSTGSDRALDDGPDGQENRAPEEARCNEVPRKAVAIGPAGVGVR